MAGITNIFSQTQHEHGVEPAADPAICAAVASAMAKVLEVQRSVVGKLAKSLGSHLVAMSEGEAAQYPDRLTTLLLAIGVALMTDDDGEEGSIPGIDNFMCLAGPYSQEHYAMLWLVMDCLDELFTACTDEEAEQANATPSFVAWEAKDGNNYRMRATVFKAAYELSEVACRPARREGR